VAGLGNFINNPPNGLIIWLSLLLFGVIVFLVWRTIHRRRLANRRLISD
jgi:hypothetical protein